MTVRTQTVLGITPIFTVLGAAIGLVLYSTEKAEILWGLEEEVSSFAVSLAEFLSEGRPDPGVDNLNTLRDNNRIQSLFDYGQLEWVRRHRLTEEGIQPDAPQGNEYFSPPESPKFSELSSDKNGDITLVEPLRFTDPDETPFARAFSSVRGEDGTVTGYIEAVVSACRLDVRSRELLWRIGFLTLGLTIIGYLLSVLLSRFLTRRLGYLEEAARIVAGGSYDHQIEPHTIKELNDLGGTFNTMSSIIRDTLAKARSQLVESEQFREPVDLAVACRQLGLRESELEWESQRWLTGVAGGAPSGVFAGLLSANGAPGAMLGRVAASDPLEATTQARAALKYLQRLLEGDTPVETALAKVSALFPLAECHLVLSDAKLEPGSVETLTWSPDEELARTRHQVVAGDPLVLTTGSPELAERIRTFLSSTGEALTPRDMAFLFAENSLEGYFVARTETE